jgi:hypothetical protein
MLSNMVIVKIMAWGEVKFLCVGLSFEVKIWRYY